MESRHHVYINNPEANKKEAHCDNFIKTTKYTWWNFLFKNLFYQYHNVSTIFFTLNMIIALIPGVSPLLPITTVLPLFAILSVSAFREGLEDYSRYRNDLSANRKPVFILRNSRKVKLRAQDIHTGDFFYLHRDELVPCDCLLLATNDREGVVYVDTANLDGETNLKPKDCHMDLKARYDCLLNIDSEGSLLASEDTKGRIEMPKPDGNTHECHGRIYFENATTTIRFNLKNILLRGSTLRNCDVAALLAVHTGSQTKISLNVKESVVKQSRIDLKLNYIVRIIFVWHQVLVFSISGVSILFRKNYLMKFFSGMDSSISGSITSYLVDKNVTFFFGRSYATYYVLLSAMIPISLFVTVEFCKAIQARFMEWDVLMHSKEGKMHANSYALHEELSQIQCVFTDKTGTLTKNHMLYAGCWLPGGYSYDEILSPKSLLKRWQSSKCTRDERQEIELFLKCLTICNTVIVLNDESGNILYDGSSPDEVALVRGALNNGFKLTGRSSDTVSYLKELDRVGRACSEKVLCVLPFSSHRKMMSIVVEHANNELILYTKGADSSIIPRLFDTSPKAVTPVTTAISEFSQKGLRTLVWAYRPLTRHEFEDWFRQWEDIAINTKSPRSRESSIDEACLKLEKKMMLVGCSAIEDELQEGVVQTIQFLINAKIRVWMLTGDKRETAINIAVRSAIVNLDHDTLFGLETTQLSGDHLLGAILSATERARTLRALNKNACAIVEGSDLMVVEGLSICFLHFKRLLFLMNSTICCRLTPKQKANMVAAFQEEGFTALAIGDGANDISMIREARVGVAVIGMEGSQATRSCDYVIPRFRHLTRLMAVHGRYCLLRNSALIQYSLYKNMLIAFVQTFYAFFNGYSGYSLHDSWLLMLYNLVFTALPPLAMGLLDFDIRDEALLNHPELYSELRKPLVMRLSSITTVLWIIAAFAQSSVLFFTHIPYMLSDEGGPVTIAGTLQMTGAILYILTQAAVVYPSWTVFHFFAIILSVIAFLLFVFVYPHLAALFWLTDYMGAAQRMLFQCSTYIHLIFWFFVVLSYEIAFLALFRGRYKGPTHSIHAKYAQNRFMQSLRDFVHDWQGSNKHSDDDIAQLRWDNLEQTESLLIENAWDHSSLLPSYSLELNVEPSVMMMDDNQDQVCLTENQSSSPFLNIELL